MFKHSDDLLLKESFFLQVLTSILFLQLCELVWVWKNTVTKQSNH